MTSGTKQRHFWCKYWPWPLSYSSFVRKGHVNLLDFFHLSSIHSEFQLLFETKANTFLFGTSYVQQTVPTQDFIINVFVWYVEDFITKTSTNS